MRRYTIRDPIFGALVTLLIGKAQAYNRFITKRFPNIAAKDLAVPGDDALYEARKCPDGTKDRFIWLPDWVDDNDHVTRLTHECVHATAEILRWVGIKHMKKCRYCNHMNNLSVANEEVYTYYSQWLLGECLKRLQRRKQ